MAAADRLNVIGLISGGKDSFFSLLHCIEHGHRLVALANLFPAAPGDPLLTETQCIDPEDQSNTLADGKHDRTDTETDLNSFMYQTVGHEVIPLYAGATGLPLYRRQIHGSAVRHERDYDYAALTSDTADGAEETESMTPLLRSIMERHPEANAVCAGAILSTYQRTRVESIALRLGLTPLAFLWKYPVLPSPTAPTDEAQLLKDMAAVELDARIIKVASAGLDDDHLWLRASSHQGAERIKRALRKFGAAQGAALGEGGEFETLVVDGPRSLFRKTIRVPADGRSIMREGGGTSWLKVTGALLEDKPSPKNDPELSTRQPDLLDSRFHQIMSGLTSPDFEEATKPAETSADAPSSPPSLLRSHQQMMTRTITPRQAVKGASVQSQTANIVEETLKYFEMEGVDASQVPNTIIVLRNMADFPVINAEYAKLFPRANPPARVTISCGALLPADIDIILSVSMPHATSGRQGLHVQSRSYWAPANIGPYSQGITIPLLSEGELKSLRLSSIAGQIPLIPAKMVLPEPSSTSLPLQITLSLQHLWRIGADMKVQFWTGAVAYFSRAKSDADMQQRARLAGYAWRQAHGSPDDDDDESGEQLDPWDLKHNSQYMTLGEGGAEGPTPVPDWSVLALRQQNEWEARVPPVFAAEVESLPRQAEVEWHAQAGIGGATNGALEAFSLGNVADTGCEAWCSLVRESDTVFLHTTVAYKPVAEAGEQSGSSVALRLDAACREGHLALRVASEATEEQSAYLMYLDAGAHDTSEMMLNEKHTETTTVPCHSLWAADGSRRTAVALYRSVFSKVDA